MAKVGKSWMDAQRVLEINRAHWDAAAEAHGNGDDMFYDVAGLLAGRDVLSEVDRTALREAVGSVEGLDVLHVQCHIGLESVSLSRRGARVTGVDLSPASLRKAARLAAQCGESVAFAEGDCNALPARLHDRFDLAFASTGVIFFAPDLTLWMRSVASTLRPGGRLLLSDYHPLYTMFSSFDPPYAVCHYQDTGPHVSDEPGTYAVPEARLASPTVVTYRHTLATIVTAAVTVGLRVVSLAEHTAIDFHDAHNHRLREEDGRVRTRLGGGMVPVMFSLVAEKER